MPRSLGFHCSSLEYEVGVLASQCPNTKLRAVNKYCSWDLATAGTTDACCGSGCELQPGRCLLVEGVVAKSSDVSS